MKYLKPIFEENGSGQIQWTVVENPSFIPSEIPSHIYVNRSNVLIEDINGFVGVGYWDSSYWVLNIPDDFYESGKDINFNKIKRFCLIG